MTRGRDRSLGHGDQDGYLDRLYCGFVVSTRALVFLAFRRPDSGLRNECLGWWMSRDGTQWCISERELRERGLG